MDSENKRKGIRIANLIDELIDEISSLKPDEVKTLKKLLKIHS